MGKLTIGWIEGLAGWREPRSELTKADIPPCVWPDGTMPASAGFDARVAGNFSEYRLRVDGLLDRPQEFSLTDLKPMPEQNQITMHVCIQGWSGVAERGGVRGGARTTRSNLLDAHSCMS